jgi:hypothetical protein
VERRDAYHNNLGKRLSGELIADGKKRETNCREELGAAAAKSASSRRGARDDSQVNVAFLLPFGYDSKMRPEENSGQS